MKLFNLLSAGLGRSSGAWPGRIFDRSGRARQLVDQLKAIGLSTRRIGLIGASRYHFDLVRQATDFPSATLLIVSELPSPAIESA